MAFAAVIAIAAMIAIAAGVCLSAAHFGPYQRSCPFVLMFGLTLILTGAAFFTRGAAAQALEASATTFFAAFLFSYARWVRARLRAADEAHRLRLTALAAELLPFPRSSSDS